MTCLLFLKQEKLLENKSLHKNKKVMAQHAEIRQEIG
jgi:hypothetical protein